MSANTNMKYKITIEQIVDSNDFDPELQTPDEVKDAYESGVIDLDKATVTVVAS